MYDYDAEYRRLRAAGLEGWAGSQHERNHARLAETLDRLARESFPKPPDSSLSVNPWWDHVTMTCRITNGEDSSR